MATTLTKAAVTVVASATNAAGAVLRGTVDMRTSLGGLLTIKIVNGATGPSTQCGASILAAHNDGATPTAAAAGTDWKTIYKGFGNGTANNTVGEWAYEVPAGVMHMEVEFGGNTGQDVTVEAYLSRITNAVTA